MSLRTLVSGDVIDPSAAIDRLRSPKRLRDRTVPRAVSDAVVRLPVAPMRVLETLVAFLAIGTAVLIGVGR